MNMQTRGLVVLLLSKAAGHTSTCSDASSVGSAGVTSRQQTLAELTEMIHTAHLIHKGILNLSSSSVPDKKDLHDLQFGNKISILSGDYLLANACKGLANVRNCKVTAILFQFNYLAKFIALMIIFNICCKCDQSRMNDFCNNWGKLS